MTQLHLRRLKFSRIVSRMVYMFKITPNMSRLIAPLPIFPISAPLELEGWAPATHILCPRGICSWFTLPWADIDSQTSSSHLPSTPAIVEHAVLFCNGPRNCVQSRHCVNCQSSTPSRMMLVTCPLSVQGTRRRCGPVMTGPLPPCKSSPLDRQIQVARMRNSAPGVPNKQLSLFMARP